MNGKLASHWEADTPHVVCNSLQMFINNLSSCASVNKHRCQTTTAAARRQVAAVSIGWANWHNHTQLYLHTNASIHRQIKPYPPLPTKLKLVPIYRPWRDGRLSWPSWLVNTEMAYPPEDSHLSKYYRARLSFNHDQHTNHYATPLMLNYVTEKLWFGFSI